MVILFDGVCNLCNGMVKFVIKRDKKHLFQFASLQSTYGRGLLEHFKLTEKGMDTILLYDGRQVLTRTDATLTILNKLGGIWKLFNVFKIVPRFIRNFVYNTIAANRYRLFGKSENCMVPTPEIKNRFIDEKVFS
jgi:predicted DCC family thiol-disulfide oxidoreductase YuxK